MSIGTDVVAPVMLTTGMIVGVRTVDKVSRVGEKKSSKKTRKKSKKSKARSKSRKKRSPPANSYYCRKCKCRHFKNSKIGKLHKRSKK